ncbi:MAG: hypothetical protein A2V67_01145 [Deltaproteobacteria bacterium RBG_13_61_14]|nr:MAG: hypothetical protein A2V67_01145 [Deltaproteobacteria bacterium RBG_13_61_14]
MSDSQPSKRPVYDPLQPLGVFLGVVGLAVVSAVFMPMPLVDRIINLAAGLTILGIGIAFIVLGHRRAKKAREQDRSRAPGP